MIARESVRSSNVKAIGYDADRAELHVEFLNGRVYVYHGVDAATHAALMAAPSQGAYLHRHIKGAYVASQV